MARRAEYRITERDDGRWWVDLHAYGFRARGSNASAADALAHVRSTYRAPGSEVAIRFFSRTSAGSAAVAALGEG